MPFRVMSYGPHDWVELDGWGASHFFERLADEELSYLAVAEPPGRSSYMTADRLELLGIGFDATSKAVDGIFVRAEESSPMYGELPISGGPDLGSGRGRGLVASNVDLKLFVFGGKDASGQVHETAWSLDFINETWEEFPVPSAERPAEVLSATFRVDDRQVYFVDKPGSKYRLCRFRRGSAMVDEGVEVLAELHSSWSATVYRQALDALGAGDAAP